MSDSTQRPDWRRMHPRQFGSRTKAAQDALFLTDATDDYGTETLDGFGFGATFFAGVEPAPGGEPDSDPGQ